jgi:phosphomevalonate kinase
VSEIRIPGKVLLSGEYAVLCGGTAVALPVPRYFTVRPATAMPSMSYPPVAAAAFSYTLPDLELPEGGQPVAPPCELDYRDLRGAAADGSVIKLGLGSSAAEAVGVLAWRYQAAGLAWESHRVPIAEHALAVHSAAQRGLGSGIDVLVCAYGEGLRLRLVDGRRVFNLLQPADLASSPPLALVHTGVAANTRTLVTRFMDWRAAAGPAGEHYVDAICQSADELALAWGDGAWPGLLAALDTFDTHLRLCLDAAKIHYMLPYHYELAEWAQRHGGRAKPTGAGGGDMALLVGDLPYHELGQEVIRLATL